MKLNILKDWEQTSAQAKKKRPIKTLAVLPKMPGIAPKERFIKAYGLWYLLTRKEGRKIWSYLLRHPFKYTLGYFKALFSKVVKKGDLFFYGVKNEQEWIKKARKSLVVIGFSYCEKPFECPDQRFSDKCRWDPNHLVCQQCPIGKARTLIPKSCITLIIPTVHDIGIALFKLRDQYPKKNITFMITACEMTLEMFRHWSTSINVQGIGIRLQGRICNTKKAFELSEKGIKPGLTCVTKSTHEQMLEILSKLHT